MEGRPGSAWRHKAKSVPWFGLTATSAAALGAFGLTVSIAAVPLDYWGEPPMTDPSAYTAQPAQPSTMLQQLFTMPGANEGAKETTNGQYLTKTQLESGNVLSNALTSFNYPTNGNPSPMWGAQPFTQKMLMFEEFGTEKLDANGPVPALNLPLPALGPAPAQDPKEVAASAPPTADMDKFLAQAGIAPYPSEYANTSALNPWKSQIEAHLNRFLTSPPAEGRPPGMGWAHQRWHEFYPQVFFKTVQAGARPNGGIRDARQMHHYAVGEFGPGGLYHNTTGLPGFEGTTKGIQIRIHPNMPVQNHNSVWTFDGTLPPKLLMVRYGQPVLMRHYNALPINPSANRGFGLHTISTHEHNGHSPAESDGYANAFFFPGQFYDYRWPIQLAGYDTINTTASDPRAAFPCSPGETLWVNDATPGMKTCKNGRIQIRGDWHETMSTHWFHDHMMDFTAQNVYKGNAVMMNYYSALDRGNESVNDGVNLRLPSGSGLPWGNRDYDVNLLVADKAWDKDGQLWFNPFNTDGFIGDRLLVNWQWEPYLDVRARRYRFRILNGSVSRFLAVAMVQQVKGNKGEFKGPPGSGVSYNRVPFHMIANDGNIMEHAVPFDGTMDLNGDGNKLDHFGQLPTQGIAERYDIVVDFSKFKPGDKLYFVNVKEHDTGIGTKRNVPLADVLSEKYKAVIVNGSGGKQQWSGGDPAVGRFLEVRVQAYAGKDLSMNPADYEPAKPGQAEGKKMIPLWLDRNAPADQFKIQTARRRDFQFGRSGGGSDAAPWSIQTDGQTAYSMDPRRISAAPQLSHGPTDGGWTGPGGTMEVWHLKTGGGWSHPVHVHFEEGILLTRGGLPPPEWEKWARKDVYRIGSEPDSTQEVEFAIHFREFAGTYMEHCHNTQHEDNSMLLRWDIERPGQFMVMPTPLPTWDGVQYVKSVGEPLFRTGSGFGMSTKQ